MTIMDERAAWNQVSAHYQSQQEIPTHSVHYGPWAPLENELGLLGNVQGKRILELGCGGGQCSIAFARQGAHVTALDLSDAQLDFARALARQEGVHVRFVQGVMEDLSALAENEWDIGFSVYALQYSADPLQCLAEIARVLRPGALLAFSVDHPFRNCFVDSEDDEVTIYASRSYFDHRPMRWVFGETGVQMQSHHHTIAEWLDLLNGAGFTLQRLVEPQPSAEMLDGLWPADSALAALRNIPQTIIFVATKRGQF